LTTRAQATALRGQLVTLTAATVLPIVDLAAIVTAAWYAELDPSSQYVPTDEQSAVNEGRINYTLKWAFEQSGQELPVDRMVGAFQRMVFDSSRAIVVDNAKLERVPWHRDALPDACSFCRLLTVDPHAYSGKYVDMPSHNHDCRCLAVVSRGNNSYQPPSYVDAWRREVEANKSGDLTSTLAGMDDRAV
jgi:hypothetical protein